MMCMYEIFKGNNFDIDNLCIQHHCRKEQTISEAIGEEPYCTKTCSITNDMLMSAD